MSKTRETALDAFTARKAQIDAQLARLQTLSADHFNVSPDKAHWGNVGDLSHYLELLTRITDAAFQEGEHARTEV